MDKTRSHWNMCERDIKVSQYLSLSDAAFGNTRIDSLSYKIAARRLVCVLLLLLKVNTRNNSVLLFNIIEQYVNKLNNKNNIDI